MKYIYYSLFLFFLSLSFWNCADIIEPDLSDSEVKLISPTDSFATNLQTITFSWEETDDVLTYNIQIVKPNFITPLTFVLDSNVTDDRFVMTLNPGEYQWRVIGKNTNTNTLFHTFNLTITEDSLLDNQIINLLSPTNNSNVNNVNVNFLWQAISSADSYRIQCASPDFSNSTFLVFNESVTTDNYSTNLQDGEYRWRVRAENSLGISEYTEFGFSIDTQAPNTPMLTSPAADAIVASPVELVWTYDISAIVDSVYIYSDSLTTQFESDAISNLPYSFSNGITDSTYYWRVRSFDSANNASQFSTARKFTIQ